METTSVSGLVLFFDAAEREAAGLIRQACEKSVQLVRENWGLDTPQDCRVYVMTSWLRFAFHSAPWSWRVLLGASMPFWALRTRRLWQYTGGWSQGYGERQTVGVKPPHLIQLGDRSIGDRIFVREKDVYEKVQHITCHELTHAFTAHLKLPAWLHEGLAMITVDKFAARPTVQSETLATFERLSNQISPGASRKLRLKDLDAVVYQYVRGYWLTRYIKDTRPELLKSLLARRHRRDELETRIATAYEKKPEEFWREIDRAIVPHFAHLT